MTAGGGRTVIEVIMQPARIGSRPFLLLLLAASASVLAAEPTASVPDTLEQRVLACAACHGKQGEGIRQNVYYPRIAGKPAQYLYQQLVNFREGKRGFPQMVYFVRYLSDEYLMEIAVYYSKLQPGFPTPIRPTSSKDAMSRGEVLVKLGDPAKDVPPCAACHGKALTGMQPAIPGLLGLYPDYINAQLGAWQRGVRHAAEPDCMAKIATRLNGRDVAAVSAWLSSQPGSPATLPEPQAQQKLPLACGTQLQ
jgi:cytochrome c553